MKRGITVLTFLLFSSVLASAACEFETSLINQDPYPAVPGDYVKLVFQVEGLGESDCGDITFHLLEDYPLQFDPGETGIRRIDRVGYSNDFDSNILIPFDVRVDKDALDGTNPIEVQVTNNHDGAVSKTLDLEVEDVTTDFEVYVKNYNFATNELTIEVLNIEDSDVDALTIEIPRQTGIEVKGSNRIVVGDLDSNEYTTADFEATVQEGEFTLNLIYSDSINERRTLTKTVMFDSNYFMGRAGDVKATSPWSYAFFILLLYMIIMWFVRRRKAKKSKLHKHR